MSMDKIKNANILRDYGEELMSYCQKKFGFKDPPNLFYITDQDNYHKLLGKTAYYDPEAKTVAIYITGRHPKDILRSLAHELVHHMQNLNGEFYSQKTLGPGYAQTDSRMREKERKAYEMGNLAFRDWEDEKKLKYKGEKIMIENNLKEAIKLIVEKKLRSLREGHKVGSVEEEESVEEASAMAGAAVEGFAGGVIKEPVAEDDVLEEEWPGSMDDPSNIQPGVIDNSDLITPLMAQAGEMRCAESGWGTVECQEIRDEIESMGGDPAMFIQDIDAASQELGPHSAPEIPDDLAESNIQTPEQEESFHSKLFGPRLIALNARLMSNFIKK
jgi:hypothetical protein